MSSSIKESVSSNDKMGCSMQETPKAGGQIKVYRGLSISQIQNSRPCYFSRKVARELSERADDLFERGKELVNETKEEIAAQLGEAQKPHTAEKSKAKAV